MKKMYMHIGLGKTGSSALQSWLSLNSDNLADQSIDYADLVPGAKHGEVTSGNGILIFKAIQNNDLKEVERLIREVYFSSADSEVAIVSCEMLHQIRKPMLSKIQEICARHDIKITVIAYMRSVYERAFSAYVQSIKRNGVSKEFGHQDVIENFSSTVTNLKKYADVYGDDIILLNYDDLDKDIFTSFAAVTGIELKGMKPLLSRVNRSLSVEEIDVMRKLNALHGGMFSTPISRHLITQSPDRQSDIFYIDSVLEQVRSATAEDLNWINQKFEVKPPIKPDLSTGNNPSSNPVLLAEAYQTVASWALDYKPAPSSKAEYCTFLNAFAPLLQDISNDTSTSRAIAAKARKLQAGPVKSVFMTLLGR